MSDIIWARFGTSLRPVKPYVQEQISKGIYALRMDAVSRELYLTKVGEKFNLPPKVYDIESAFIKKAVSAWRKSDKNLGILLNGYKGGGKTMTAKLISNEINIPVIVVDHAYDGLPDIISQLNFDCIVLIDEYEKIFSDDERGLLLSVMDGTKTQSNKILFLLTTNTMRVNDNLINRPSRIRYLKEYRDLSKKAIEEIVDDLLVNKEFRSDTIDVISELESITMDSVVEIIKESNAHNENPKKFIEYFNVGKNRTSYKYKLTALDNESETYEVTTRGSIYPGSGVSTLVINTTYKDKAIGFHASIKRHTGNGNIILHYANPELLYINVLIDELYDKTDDENNEEEKVKQNAERARLENIKNSIPKVIEKEFNFVFSFDKNWMYVAD